MRLQLKDHLTNHLRKLPESGMGFQLVDIRLKNGGYPYLMVENSSCTVAARPQKNRIS